MSNLTLTITDRALERLRAIGPACEVYIDQIGMGCSAALAALVKSCEDDKMPTDATHVKLTKEGVDVWVPKAMSFKDDDVVIDLQGIFFMVVPMVLSAEIQQPAHGGCAGCSGCGSSF